MSARSYTYHHHPYVTQNEAMSIAERDATYQVNARLAVSKRARREISPWMLDQILSWCRRAAVRRAMEDKREYNFRTGGNFAAPRFV